jgi:hypothetical protein
VLCRVNVSDDPAILCKYLKQFRDGDIKNNWEVIMNDDIAQWASILAAVTESFAMRRSMNTHIAAYRNQTNDRMEPMVASLQHS